MAKQRLLYRMFVREIWGTDERRRSVLVKEMNGRVYKGRDAKEVQYSTNEGVLHVLGIIGVFLL